MNLSDVIKINIKITKKRNVRKIKIVNMIKGLVQSCNTLENVPEERRDIATNIIMKKYMKNPRDMNLKSKNIKKSEQF